jgi:ATP-binding cassette subfamily F protein uup
MAAHATDHEKLLALDAELKTVRAEREESEEQWLELAEGA